MKTFADNIIAFNASLRFDGELPKDIHIMNPFGDPAAFELMEEFYKRFYDDRNPRKLILGINPGRFGAGITGIPFTDTKRLYSLLGKRSGNKETHEPSSVFVYRVVEKYGGPERFFGDLYINAVCPLGFTIVNSRGREVNYNYYDQADLQEAVRGFIVESIRKQLAFGVSQDKCYCLGTGKNFKFLHELNRKERFFGEVVPLEHPRFIVQYRSKQQEEYAAKYTDILGEK